MLARLFAFVLSLALVLTPNIEFLRLDMGTLCSRPLDNVVGFEIHLYSYDYYQQHSALVRHDSSQYFSSREKEFAVLLEILKGLNDSARVGMIVDEEHAFPHDKIYAIDVFYNDRTWETLDFSESPRYIYRLFADKKFYVMAEDSAYALCNFIRYQFDRLKEAESP